MKLIVLCVDGLDPDYARELGFPKMPYESKLKIPKELYFNEFPHTLLVWPSMLSGRIVITKIPRPIWFSGIRIPIRRVLHKYGIKFKREKPLLEKKIRGKANPVNMNIETVANNYNSIMWNIPTINADEGGIFHTPEDLLRNQRRKYKLWKIISDGMCLYPYDLSLAYCHLVDTLAHLEKPLEEIYLDVYHHAMRLSKHRSVMLVSDHGCLDGEHTHHAYLGCTEPIEAENVMEVRADIERILSSRARASK